MSEITRKVVDVNTALYRRYRPDAFAEVIGQEQVTDPLMAALRADRVTHAYLFSGPRGCGKTTSARILARCLNCAQGPTDTPCGQCDSCRELATGGPGSLDVVEIDAASHNGVDDARELRERAIFAPVRDRYKIFILDEAHMVTPQGFNALLKLVEEPPEHVKFIFATTEPDKVISTIRSRTHHYPFRLVAPEVLEKYLHSLCESEQVNIGAGVLPLVVRAGAGSVRDCLSVLDQLMGGAQEGTVSYERAVSLLGYTDSALLDSAIQALGVGDGNSTFQIIERMVESGHDPRRFTEDLLQRLRDLLIIAVAGAQADDALMQMPNDQRERMQLQANMWGARNLSGAADLTNTALSAMVGATSARLQVELLCARILLAIGISGAPRVESISSSPQKSVSNSTNNSISQGAVSLAGTAQSSGKAPVPPVGSGGNSTQSNQRLNPPPGTLAEQLPSPSTAVAQGATSPIMSPIADPIAAKSDCDTAKATETSRAQSTGTKADVPAQSGISSGVASGDFASDPLEDSLTPSPAVGAKRTADSAIAVRDRWEEVVAHIAQQSRVTWSMVKNNAQVARVEGDTVYLSFSSTGIAQNFVNNDHSQVVMASLQQVLGVYLQVQAQGVSSPPAASRPSARSAGANTAEVRGTTQATVSTANWGPVAQPGQTTSAPERQATTLALPPQKVPDNRALPDNIVTAQTNLAATVPPASAVPVGDPNAVLAGNFDSDPKAVINEALTRINSTENNPDVDPNYDHEPVEVRADYPTATDQIISPNVSYLTSSEAVDSGQPHPDYAPAHSPDSAPNQHHLDRSSEIQTTVAAETPETGTNSASTQSPNQAQTPAGIAVVTSILGGTLLERMPLTPNPEA